MQATCKECHLTLLCVERHLVMPAPLRDACDGFLHDSLGGKLEGMATELGDVICKHFDFNVNWYNDLQIVDYEVGNAAAIVLTPAAAPVCRFERKSRSYLAKVRGRPLSTGLNKRSSFQTRPKAFEKSRRVRTVRLVFVA